LAEVATWDRLDALEAWNTEFEDSYAETLALDPAPELKKIVTASLELLIKTQKTIRELFVRGEKITALFLYIGFIQKYAFNDRLKRLEAFQIDDMLTAIIAPECMWVRCRRGGKTRDMSLLAIFFSLCGQPVIWFAPATDQLKAAVEWCMANPFCTNITQNEVNILNSPSFDLSILTKGKTASKGRSIIFFDEGGKIDINLLQYEYFKYARAIVADKFAFGGESHIIHASTPAVGTALENTYRDLLKLNAKLVSFHTYLDCWWITEEWVLSEEEKNDKWYTDQEYRCLFVPRGGALLNNIVIIDYQKEGLDLKSSGWGVDYNVTMTFAGIFTNPDQTDCWVTEELDLDYFQDGQRQEAEEILDNGMCEVEDGGFNWYISRVMSRDFNVKKSEWLKEQKGERLTKAKKFDHIYVDPKRTPKLYADLSSAIYHGTQNIWLKDKRHPCHWLDAFMHAIGAGIKRVYGHGKTNRSGDRFRFIARHK